YNCGACGVECKGDLVCLDGACGCSDDAPDQCGLSCFDFQTDPNNCGGCGLRCEEGEICQLGECILDCTPGTGNCDNNKANGCEAVLGGDPAHCGACGNACVAGASCAEGQCTCDGSTE